MQSPIIQRRFRISIDIETVIKATPDNTTEGRQYYQAFIQQLLAHPKILDQFLRSSAVDALKSARKMIALEYGWDKISDQQLFQPIFDRLEPAEQAYFVEEIEAGIPVYDFDGYESTVMQFTMKELDEESNGNRT